MAKTQLTGIQIKDGTVFRADLNTTISGQAIVRQLIAGSNVSFNSTGADSGTGDVTINALGGSGSTENQVLTGTNYNAAANDHIWLDSTAVIQITLPSNPSNNDKVIITDMKGLCFTNNCSVLRNGKLIRRLSEDYLIDLNGITNTFVYISSLGSWEIQF